LSVRRQKYKKHSRLSKKQLCGIIVAALVVVSILAVYSFNGQTSDNNAPKAAIIDQLSSLAEFTNATFVQTATNMLAAAGYRVTYYKGSDVNVNFFQTLPTDGYKVLIFRVHSALRLENIATGALGPPLDFFTSEPYSRVTYGEMQELNQLDIVMYNQTSTTQYFGINPNFVMDAMQGNFGGATIILEGCNGLDGQGRSSYAAAGADMLAALIGRGAKAIIGWNASVSVNHTDTATLSLLQHMLADNETVREAINATNREIGPDPAYDNQLLYYPSPALGCGTNDIGNYTLPHYPPTQATIETSSLYTTALVNEGFLATPTLLSATGPYALKKPRKKDSSVSHSA